MLPSPVWSLWSCHHHVSGTGFRPPQGVGQPPNHPQPRAPTLPSLPSPPPPARLGVTAGPGRAGGSICLPCHAPGGCARSLGRLHPQSLPPTPLQEPTARSANSAASLLCSNPSSARARAHPRLAGGRGRGSRRNQEASRGRPPTFLQTRHLLVLRSSPRRLRPAGGLLPARPRARERHAPPHQEEASSFERSEPGLASWLRSRPWAPPSSRLSRADHALQTLRSSPPPPLPTLAAPALGVFAGRQSRGLRCRKP